MNGYSRVQIALHWLTALAIGVSWLTGEGMGSALRAKLNGTLDATPFHVQLGLVIFALVALRVVVRFFEGVPEPVSGTTPEMEKLAVWGHRILYLLMVLVPLLGVANWYGGVRLAGDAHELAGNAFIFVALGHAAVAIWHQIVLGDGTLTRMLRPRS